VPNQIFDVLLLGYHDTWYHVSTSSESPEYNKFRRIYEYFVYRWQGYIGSATAEALLRAGHSVTIYDRSCRSPGGRAEGAHFIQEDLGDAAALRAALTDEKYTAVMHFAAFIEAGESMREPGKS